ncbi:MAG TPA: zinc ribbon domain-containing protein [Gaiellaceae bacterium]|nr:zinc ribbon domain-containing protein [Gaiellaceae bacterium]HLF68182.1 zinc ribbon domain-containing protein [Gaiellaceae bacterium]
MTLAGAMHLAQTFESVDWTLARNAGILLVAILWLATAYWVFKDARRRIGDAWLVALATLVGLVPPFLGPIVYLLFRPPEYLEDVRERELEIRAMEERLADLDRRCPVCRARVEASYLVCPVCTTRLKQACPGCGQPLEALWQICPYCATEIPPALPALEDITARPRSRPRRQQASD